MFTLDTNILIYYGTGDEKVVSFFRKHREQVFYLPTIVAAEFLSHRLADDETFRMFRAFAAQTVAIGLDISLAEQAAALRRAYGLKLADAVVAATALLTRSALVTRNTTDFRKVPGLDIISL